jgi:hypothetical protein
VIEVMRNPKAVPADSSSAPKVPSNTSKSQQPAVNPSQTQTTPAPQTQIPAPPVQVTTPAPVPVPITRTLEKITVVTIPDGAPVPITLSADVPAEVQEGQPVHFTVAQDFKAGDTVVIAKGSVVNGAVVDVGGKKKFLGMGGGKVTFRLMQVDAIDGHKLNIRATPAKSPNGPAQRPLEPVNKKPPKELVATAGTEYIGYVDGEQTVSVKK